MSVGFGFSLPALAQYGGGGNNPFGQLGPTLDLSFVDGATGVTDLFDPNGYTLNTNFIAPEYQVAAQYTIWETNVGLVSKTFSQIITFTRASTATYFDSTGTLQSAAINDPRLDYNPSTLAAQGLLIEEAKTNLLLQSEAFNITHQLTVTGGSGTFIDGETVTATGGGTGAYIAGNSTATIFAISNGTGTFTGTLTGGTSGATRTISSAATAWTKANSSITANATTSPDGTVTADKLIEALDVNLVHQVAQAAVTIVSLGTYTASCYVKADTRTRVRIAFIVGGTSGVVADANLSAGTIGAATAFGGGSAAGASIQAINNGWYRITVTGTGAAGTSSEFRLELLDASGNRQYNGDGTSGLFIWGAQLEAGAFPTSYIPTTTTALTRAADVASVNTLSPWYNATEGTLFAEARYPFAAASGLNSGFAEIDDGTFNEAIANYVTSGGNSTFVVRDNSATQAGVTVSGMTANTVIKIAGAYAVNDFQQATNGTLGVADTSGSLPTVTRLALGDIAVGQKLNGWLRRVSYYPTRLSNAQLQAITA